LSWMGVGVGVGKMLGNPLHRWAVGGRAGETGRAAGGGRGSSVLRMQQGEERNGSMDFAM
jgi:hypothetical protein